MKLRMMIIAVVIAVSTTMSAMASSSIRVQLCLDSDAKKDQELLVDLVELSLLLRPQIETLPCGDKASSYVLKQRSREITERGKKTRYEITSAVYDPAGIAIFGQVEFLDEASRKVMNERAHALADAVVDAMMINQPVPDPFLRSSAVSDVDSRASVVMDTEVDEYRDIAVDKTPSTRSLGVFVGMERFAQLGFGETFLRSRELVVTKSFMILGVDFFQKLFDPFVFKINARGGAAALELVRPLEKNKQASTRISKLFDTSVEFAAVLPVANVFAVTFGVLAEAIFVDADLRERAPQAPLSTYWQIKEGLSFSGTVFLGVFDTRISLLSAFFPLVYNSVISNKPFKNYGWHIGLSAESTVYSSFALQFMLHHRRELFDWSLGDVPMRLVSSGTLGYLGFIARL